MPQITSGSGMLTVSIDTKKVENMMNGYEREIPIVSDKIARKIAGMYADMYIMALHKAGVEPWTGEGFGELLAQSKSPVKLGKANYGVVVPSHLIALDQMKPHFVSLKRGRAITRWAEQKLGRKFGSVFVRPHPWIRSGNISAGMNVRKIAEFETDNMLKRKGK